MGKANMVNGVPMSVIYSGMSVDRFHKLSMLLDKTIDHNLKSSVKKGDKPGLGPDGTVDSWWGEINEEFLKECARAARKAEWNNKPTNKINKIIRNKKVSK